MNIRKYILTAIMYCAVCQVNGQTEAKNANVHDLSFFEPADTFNRQRFNLALGAAATAYTGFSIALYKTWYQQYPSEGFHTFNDWGEWANVDKMGHIYTAYFQTNLAYKGSKWTGMDDHNALLTGLICGGLFQTTIEVMDGFSSKWGFSMGDMGANVLGLSTFYAQQKAWGEQRISLKVSSWPKTYPNISLNAVDGSSTTTLKERVADLYGSGYSERFLKDYNAQTNWASFNLSSILQNDDIPSWLNIAVGYGAENMFGGFENEWEIEGQQYQLSKDVLPRYRQYILSLDVDLNRVNVKSPFLKTVLSVLNIFKMPAPAVEYSSRGEWRFYLVFL